MSTNVGRNCAQTQDKTGRNNASSHPQTSHGKPSIGRRGDIQYNGACRGKTRSNSRKYEPKIGDICGQDGEHDERDKINHADWTLDEGCLESSESEATDNNCSELTHTMISNQPSSLFRKGGYTYSANATKDITRPS